MHDPNLEEAHKTEEGFLCEDVPQPISFKQEDAISAMIPFVLNVRNLYFDQ